MDKRRIDDLLAENDWIEVKPVSAIPTDPVGAKALADFEEINRFIDLKGRQPQELAEGDSSVQERVLAIRLRTFRAKPDIIEKVKGADRHGLLVAQHTDKTSITSLDDVLADFDTLRDDSNDHLFVLRHVSSRTDKDDPDFIAGRHRCEDFDTFKPLFDAVLADLAASRRKTMRFINESEIKAGDFYILNGITLYVATMDAFEARGKTQRKDTRLRVIYDNGTEAALLFRSLSRLLYRDANGRRVSDPEVGPLFKPEAEAPLPSNPAGYVYVSRPEMLPPVLRSYGSVVKVGVTTSHPKARVAQAKDDPTFLFQRAVLLKHYALYNTTPMQVEAKIHAFLAGVCLDLEIMDRFNKPYKPREWFLVDVETVDQIVARIVDGTLADYVYDRVERRIVPR